MPWTVKCSNKGCGKENWASNIVDLLERFLPGTRRSGLFKCLSCQQVSGYIEKQFDTQEGDAWAPFLRGAIRLSEDPSSSYQPFVFLVSYEPSGDVIDCWFSYYKDLRASGGRLKLGYGPGGPPVLGHSQIVNLVKDLQAFGYLDAKEI